jgi:hypothetical protein
VIWLLVTAFDHQGIEAEAWPPLIAVSPPFISKWFPEYLKVQWHFYFSSFFFILSFSEIDIKCQDSQKELHNGIVGASEGEERKRGRENI